MGAARVRVLRSAAERIEEILHAAAASRVEHTKHWGRLRITSNSLFILKSCGIAAENPFAQPAKTPALDIRRHHRYKNNRDAAASD